MLTQVVLVLKVLWCLLNLRVIELGECCHLSNLLNDYSVIHSSHCVFTPRERTVVVKERSWNRNWVQVSKTLNNNVSGLLG